MHQDEYQASGSVKPKLRWRFWPEHNAWIVMHPDACERVRCGRVISHDPPNEALLLLDNAGRSCKTTPTPPPYPETGTSFLVGV